MANQKMIKTNKKMCIDCKWGFRFNGSSDAFCDYYGMTGIRRGCLIGWCDKYEPYIGKKYRETFKETMNSQNYHIPTEEAGKKIFEV